MENLNERDYNNTRKLILDYIDDSNQDKLSILYNDLTLNNAKETYDQVIDILYPINYFQLHYVQIVIWMYLIMFLIITLSVSFMYGIEMGIAASIGSLCAFALFIKND